MEIFKLKHLVIIVVASLLWSCQAEHAFSDEVTSSKKKPLPYGIPSDADDVYEFDKSTYTHNGKVITDTLKIMNMLSSASGLHIDETGYNKQIFVTSEERESFDNTTENNEANRIAALDGDNYLHYFFEISYYVRAQDWTQLLYVNVVGPKLYSNTADFTVHGYIKESTGNPYGPNSGTFANGLTLSQYMYDSSTALPNRFTDINVKNTSRYKRRVKFISEDGRTVSRDLASRTYTTFRAASWPGRQTFAGIAAFKVKRHESIKL